MPLRGLFFNGFFASRFPDAEGGECLKMKNCSNEAGFPFKASKKPQESFDD